MTRAKGSFDFFNRECVVGTAFRVDRTYLGGQFASGEGVTLDWISLAPEAIIHSGETHVRRQNDRWRR